MEARDYQAELKSDVERAEADLASVKELYERNMPGARSADAPHPYQDKLDRAAAAVKACKARLAALRKLDHVVMTARIAELRGSATSQQVDAAVDVARGKLVKAALLRLEARLELVNADGAFRERLKEAQNLENALLGTTKTVDFHKQPGFSSFALQVSTEDMLAELERLADSQDPSPLRASLTRSPDGKLIIGGLQAREALRLVAGF